MNFSSNDISEDFATDKIYLNNASVSIMPKQSIEEMKAFLISYNSVGPDSIESEPLVTEKLRSTRKIISKIVNCQPDEIILTQSTTDGVNIVSNGLSFDSDSNIIIRGLSHEHHANLYPWLRLGNKTEIKNLPIDENGFFNFDDFNKMVDDKTKLVSLSHALYNTGAVLPIEQVGKILDNKIPFFVDSAQTVGCLDNVNVKNLRCNFMAFNGSKWLCGPMGTGLFYCDRKSSELLEPTSIGGESAMLYEESKLAFKDLPEKFQTGFRNYVGIVGLESSAKYLYKFGIDNIYKKNKYLSDLLREELSKNPKITLFGPTNSTERTSIVSFTIENHDPQSVVEKLEKQGIILAVREIYEKKIIRASPHFFNTESQILQVIDALKKL
ncbi:MAG: aminotransferase class V-fold PLP-dependent enzyme [Nitrosopumilaceae archaeon]|jgi:cysteine desulfurase/selenocysteine lyase